jgi:hypothetical protein
VARIIARRQSSTGALMGEALQWEPQPCGDCGLFIQHPGMETLDKSKPRRTDGIYGPLVCFNCLATRQGVKATSDCQWSGATNVPTQEHHVDGRKNSGRTVRICHNYHRKAHYFNQRL